MDTYINKLAPWEIKNTYYKDVKLGKSVRDIKIILKGQTEEMFKARIASVDTIVSSKDIREDVIKEISYDIKSIGLGMGGVKAAFEWGISEVVWLIEKNTEDLRNIMMSLYKVPDKQIDDLRDKADYAFAMDNMDEALERYTELNSIIKDDFSACISLGMIFLFRKIDKEKALVYFDRAAKYVRRYSTYYTSYALLYKALIKRDFGLIEEAEKYSNEAMKLSPRLVEAMYQNAQYNAILNKPEAVIPLLKKVINSDIAYCLKIDGERDFEQIKPNITELYEEIRTEKYKDVKEILEEKKKDMILLNNAVKSIEKLGYDVSQESSDGFSDEVNKEVDILVQNNSIYDAHIAEALLPFLSKKLNRKKELVKRECNQIHLELDNQIQTLGAGVVGKKKKGGTISFLVHFLCGQIVALPFGWYIGIPLGIYITEGLLFVICLYINVLLPQSQWKEVDDKQNEQEKLLRVVKRL